MAFVGLLESLMTAKLVDDITDTGVPQDPRVLGQGVANMPRASSAAWAAAR